ncbi:MAG: hypothetical protein KA267_11650 [Gemmatimonadales bacterium]|nr:hypothetical protein [Gemmatimonadales bacterium]
MNSAVPLATVARGALAPTTFQPLPAAETTQADSTLPARCPECQGPIARSARCQTCVACGWSRCV